MNERPPVEKFAPLTEAEIAAVPAIADVEAARIAKARTIVSSCRAITGTIAETYLTSRGIDALTMPKGIAGWHDESRALVFPARDKDGAVKACQRLFFGADGVPVLEHNGKKKRRTNGILTGSAMRLIGDGDVLICEGAEDGLSLWHATRQPVRVAFGVSNLGNVPLPDGAPVVIVADNDKRGIDEARKAAEKVANRGHAVKIAVPPEGVKDVNGLLVKQGMEAVRAIVAAAVPFEATTDAPPPSDDIDGEIARLAALRVIDYARERNEAAKQLGIPVAMLDKCVAAARPKEDKPGQGRLLELPEPEPWPEPVNGAGLLSGIADAVGKYVVLSKEDADTAALWCVHTFVFDAFSCTPRLAITSPEKRCGKTTLLDVVEALAARPLQTSNISAAAVFRTVEIARPTLLIDEADTFLGENEELRGILNSGHRRGGQVIRTVGEDHEPRVFSTHSPCAIALIGKLPDTLADRSVAVPLKRRLPSEPISPFRGDRVDDLKVLARKAARWTADNAERLGAADPDLPPGIFNREADNWRPLFSIAAVAGSEWPERARRAALALTGAPEDSLKVELLADIGDAFAGNDRISSDELVAYLVGLEERPWSESNHGKPMSKNQLARRLKPFGLKPKTIREPGGTAKGYMLADFNETCTRYLPPPFGTVTSCTTNDSNRLRENQPVTRDLPVTVSKSINRSNINDVTDVTVQKGGNGQREHIAAPGHRKADDADTDETRRAGPEAYVTDAESPDDDVEAEL